VSESIWRRVGWWSLLLPPAFIVALYISLRLLPELPVVAAKIRECDRQVAVLLSTHDAVELERAKFLVRYLRCDIAKRLSGG
jgi:hypothetical protein